MAMKVWDGHGKLPVRGILKGSSELVERFRRDKERGRFDDRRQRGLEKRRLHTSTNYLIDGKVWSQSEKQRLTGAGLNLNARSPSSVGIHPTIK